MPGVSVPIPTFLATDTEMIGTDVLFQALSRLKRSTDGNERELGYGVPREGRRVVAEVATITRGYLCHSPSKKSRTHK